MIFVFIVVALILGILYFFKKVKTYPPGPLPLPFIGNILTTPAENLDTYVLSLKEKYGPVFTLWLPTPTIFICDHKIINQTIIKQGDLFSARPDQFLIQQILKGNFGIFFGDSEWVRSQRRLTMHLLRDLGVGQQCFEDEINSACDLLCNSLHQMEGKPVDMRPYLTRAVGSVIHNMLFGNQPNNEKELFWFQGKNNKAFEQLQSPKMLLLDSFPFLRHFDKLLGLGLKEALQTSDELLSFFEKKVSEHKACLEIDQEPKNFIDAYLRHRALHNENEESAEFSDFQLGIIVFDLYSAGLESIVVTLQSCILFMMNYPEVTKRLHEEVDARYEANEEVVYSHHHDLHYVCAFLQEIDRICYVLELNLNREASDTVVVGDFSLPAGTRVVPQFPAIHMDPAEFPDPDRLDPERFLQNGYFVKDSRITPFSVGKRACIGENFARHEIFVYFVSLIRTFDFIPVTEQPPPIKLVATPFRTPEEFQVMIRRR